MVQFLSGPQAAEYIKDGDSIALLGNGGAVLEPRMVYRCIEERFLATGSPRDLSLSHSTGIGDKAVEGMSRFAHEGMVKRVIGGHWGWSPRMQQLAAEGKIQAYNLPLGVIVSQYREIAAKRPGLIAKTGLGTYADPRIDGGRLNLATPNDLVRLIEIDGQTWLHYRPWQVDVGIVRGTTADEDGNITFEEEVAFLEAQAIAQAAHNCGGIVIAQVHHVAERGSLDPQLVKIPGMLVDIVVVDPDQWQTSEGRYDPALCGRQRKPIGSLPAMPLTQRKVIARRAAMEVKPGMIFNLGYGMPDGVASVCSEEGITNTLTATIEQGLVGGTPASGDIFGAAYNASAFVDSPSQFDFYSGGGLDLTCLGLAQVDERGNVNVSRFGTTIAGCGGFIDISQSAGTCIFCGTFTAGGLKTSIVDGELRILHEGHSRKFVKRVEHVTFSGQHALDEEQTVWYVTERCVFRLGSTGLELAEIAPGVDLQTDILDQMGFLPLIRADLKLMDPRIFDEGLMGLAHQAEALR